MHNFSKKRDSDTKTVLKDLRILNISQTIDLELCKLWHKYHLKILPHKLEQAMATDNNSRSLHKQHSYKTRNKGVNNVPLARQSKYQNSFLVAGIKQYSHLSLKLLTNNNYSSFCKTLKKEILG